MHPGLEGEGGRCLAWKWSKQIETEAGYKTQEPGGPIEGPPGKAWSNKTYLCFNQTKITL